MVCQPIGWPRFDVLPPYVLPRARPSSTQPPLASLHSRRRMRELLPPPSTWAPPSYRQTWTHAAVAVAAAGHVASVAPPSGVEARSHGCRRRRPMWTLAVAATGHVASAAQPGHTWSWPLPPRRAWPPPACCPAWTHAAVASVAQPPGTCTHAGVAAVRDIGAHGREKLHRNLCRKNKIISPISNLLAI
ncbi:hypothetical protein VPH35_015496 [Triticum aestivum]